jgi:hypothetical protein
MKKSFEKYKSPKPKKKKKTTSSYAFKRGLSKG